MPLAFFRAVEDTVRETLRQGLRGWQVLDCAVTMTHSGYSPPSSTAGDFRLLTPLVLMSALTEAGTVVCEPIHRFRPRVAGGHDRARAVRAGPAGRRPGVTRRSDGSSCVIEGDIAAARVHELRLELPGLTRGEGVLECEFGRYEPVNGTAPTRSRSDWNPAQPRGVHAAAARAVLFDPDGHESLVDDAWTPDRARAAIREIVEDVRTHSTTAGRRTRGISCTRTTKRVAIALFTVAARASRDSSIRTTLLTGIAEFVMRMDAKLGSAFDFGNTVINVMARRRRRN